MNKVKNKIPSDVLMLLKRIDCQSNDAKEWRYYPALLIGQYP